MKRLILISALLFSFGIIYAQEQDTSIVQVSGIVMTGDSLRGVPYATIAVKNSARGTFANFEGFFSIVVRKGEVLRFLSLGYREVEYVVPEDTKGNRITIVQLMTADTVNLPETIVFPWPSREHFRLEFLAMDVENPFEQTAKENLAQNRLDDIAEVMVMDGGENADYYLRSQSQNFYHYGQQPPMHIFNPFAWAKFIESWKNGDFKKKEDR